MRQDCNTLYMYIRKWFANLSLQSKIQLISIACLFSLTGASVLITNVLLRSYNNLLLDSVSASLSYANDDITQKLDSSYELSYTLLADSSLQQMLTELKAKPGSTETAGLYTKINSRLHAYYLEHQKEYISYISLYTDSFDCHTDSRKAAALSPGRIGEIMQTARNANGKAVWITDDTIGHGLLLAREIRQYDNLSLTPLGTVILCIDLDKMINSCPMFSEYDSFYYQITDEYSRLIYDSTPPGQETGGQDLSPDNRAYNGHQLIKRGNHWYLSLAGELYPKGWHYTCLVSYDKIKNTLDNSRLLSLLLLLSCCVLIVLASRYIIRSFTRHFGILLQKMQRFASSRDALTSFEPDARYNYKNRKDEIGMLHRQFDQMAEQISDLVESNYTKELLVKEAQLKALEMQINPHFLYNTLESINWRAKALGASTISLMVESLGNLFRAILSRSGESVTISEEISLVENYLTIQKCRFDTRLVYSIYTDPALSGAQVPKMIIQPLVENAVSHAMEGLSGECRIAIYVRRQQEFLEILVLNSGSRFEDDLLEKLRNGAVTPKGFGIGLLNIDKRIKLMFGSDYGLILQNENDMATARIHLPCGSLCEDTR